MGLSDPVPKVRSLDDRATEIEAVMDAAGFDTAVLMGISEGGPASILFAATQPGSGQGTHTHRNLCLLTGELG